MTDTPPLYEQLAAEVAGQITSGAFRPGDRLPSVRRISQQKGLSISTVLKAYQVLEDRGAVEVRPQSGYYVRTQSLPSFSDLEPEVTAPSALPEQVKVENLALQVLYDTLNPNLAQFGAAIPAPDLLPSDRLNRILVRLVREGRVPAAVCGTPEGCLELRTQVARHAYNYGCLLDPGEILITAGCTEAISLALRAVCQPGDLVAIESPTYFGLLQALESQGLRALEIPTHHRDGISLEALSFALEHHPIRAVLIVGNFNNPLGCCMPEENKRALVEMLAARQVPLIEDDIYGELSFEDPRPGVCKTYDRQGLVLLCSSFSKDISPGFRVGWIASGRFHPLIELQKMATSLASPLLPQYAIAEFLESGGYDHHLRKIRRAYAQKVAHMAYTVMRTFPEGTRVTSPTGGFVLWVQLPEQVDSLDLYRQALQAGMTLAPGYLFSATPRYRNFVRLNAAYMSFAAEKSIARLGELVKGLS
jgi:DNA-binding transcriptional MocR family regulator